MRKPSLEGEKGSCYWRLTFTGSASQLFLDVGCSLVERLGSRLGWVGVGDEPFLEVGGRWEGERWAEKGGLDGRTGEAGVEKGGANGSGKHRVKDKGDGWVGVGV